MSLSTWGNQNWKTVPNCSESTNQTIIPLVFNNKWWEWHNERQKRKMITITVNLTQSFPLFYISCPTIETALKVEVDQIISALFNLYSHRWPIEKGGVAYLVEMKRNTFAWTFLGPFSSFGCQNKGIWLFRLSSRSKKQRNSAFSAYKLHM